MRLPPDREAAELYPKNLACNLATQLYQALKSGKLTTDDRRHLSRFLNDWGAQVFKPFACEPALSEDEAEAIIHYGFNVIIAMTSVINFLRSKNSCLPRLLALNFPRFQTAEVNSQKGHLSLIEKSILPATPGNLLPKFPQPGPYHSSMDILRSFSRQALDALDIDHFSIGVGITNEDYWATARMLNENGFNISRYTFQTALQTALQITTQPHAPDYAAIHAEVLGTGLPFPKNSGNKLAIGCAKGCPPYFLEYAEGQDSVFAFGQYFPVFTHQVSLPLT